MKKTNNILLNHAEKKLVLTGNDLSIEALECVAEKNYKVALSDDSVTRIKKSRSFLESELKSGAVIYGVNTGFGFLSNKKISPDELDQLQINLIRSHSVGVGDFLPEDITRAIMLLRINTLAKGYSGVRVELVKSFINLLNKGVHPLIPSKGSVGASGDLAPLAHLALVIIGEGEAIYEGRKLTGSNALKAAKIKPFKLAFKEGLALINGTQVTTGILAMNFIKATRYIDLADLVGAMTLEAVNGTHNAFQPEIHQARPHPGQIKSAKNILGLLTGSEIKSSHETCEKVQDPYSLRCIPQVHGAIRDVLKYVKSVLVTEMNSSTDNPLIFPDSGKILSGGNFHAEPVAFASDFLGIAMSELASISERRIDKLLNPTFSGLPAFLAEDGGTNSGLMIVQVAAASLVSENKVLSSPASVDSIPTSADKEDHVSMGTCAALKLKSILDNTRDVLSMELLSAYQGLYLNLPLKPSKPVKRAYDILQKEIKPIYNDRTFYKDLRKIQDLINSNELIKHIRHRN